jgi:sialidase-1
MMVSRGLGSKIGYAILGAALMPVHAMAEPSDLVANAAHAVHAVLLQKQDNEIGLLEITNKRDKEAALRSVRWSWGGTTDVSDIETVRLYRGKPRHGFRTDQLLAETRGAATTLELSSPVRLQGGANVFWLACQLKRNASLDHRVQVRFESVETSVGMVKPTTEEPSRGYRIGSAVRQAGEDGVHTYRIPALATSRSGALLCVYDIRRKSSRDLQGDIDVGLSRSTDRGGTWEPMRVIMDMGKHGGLPEAENGIGDPGILVDSVTGEILVFALWVHAKKGKHQWQGDGSEPGLEIGKTAQFMITRSKDDGLSWSTPENITRLVKKEEWKLFAPSPQQGIQLRNGTLVFPVQGRDEDGAFAALIISNDHGKTWTRSSRAYSGGNECQAVELADGSIMLNIRNGDRKKRAVVVTKDLGQTWQFHPSHENGLIEPTCNASLFRLVATTKTDLPSLLLFANPRDPRRRVRQTIQVSLDEGNSWPANLHTLLDEGEGAGYPSLTRVDDDHVGIVYEGSQANLVFERLSREELLSPRRP